MKPHIWKVMGLWNCATGGRAKRGGFIGLGYTPGSAYRDWAARNARNGFELIGKKA